MYVSITKSYDKDNIIDGHLDFLHVNDVVILTICRALYRRPQQSERRWSFLCTLGRQVEPFLPRLCRDFLNSRKRSKDSAMRHYSQGYAYLSTGSSVFAHRGDLYGSRCSVGETFDHILAREICGDDARGMVNDHCHARVEIAVLIGNAPRVQRSVLRAKSSLCLTSISASA